MADEGYLTAVGKLGAPETFGPDLARQLHLVYFTQAEPLKERWLIGQAEYSGNAQSFRFLKAGFNQGGAQALPLGFPGHGHRLDFRQVGPDDVQRRTGKHTLALAVDKIFRSASAAAFRLCQRSG
jgi:hypothetical protein